MSQQRPATPSTPKDSFPAGYVTFAAAGREYLVPRFLLDVQKMEINREAAQEERNKRDSTPMVSFDTAGAFTWERCLMFSFSLRRCRPSLLLTSLEEMYQFLRSLYVHSQCK